MIELILQNLLVLLTIALVLWGISLLLKDASILDIFWGPACFIPAIATWILAEVSTPRATLLTALVSIWGLRLALHIGVRNLPHGEDYRYAYMRKRAGSDARFAVWSLWRLFAFQAVVAWFVCLPVQVGQLGSSSLLGTGTGSLGPLAWIGIALFTVGLLFEAVGDDQLRRFKRDPANKGRLMDRGLWSWTRHPNYFGDATVWLGLTLIALESRYGVYTLLSPVLMVYFLFGPNHKLLERSMAKRYPNFAEYQNRVSSFFPRPPRASRNS